MASAAAMKSDTRDFDGEARRTEMRIVGMTTSVLKTAYGKTGDGRIDPDHDKRSGPDKRFTRYVKTANPLERIFCRGLAIWLYRKPMPPPVLL